MNYGRLVAAALAGTIVDAVYGFLVYGTLLTAQFAAYPSVFRPADAQGAYMGVMFGGIFLGMVVATLIYGKGYEGGSGAVEGARFGLLMGVFLVGYMSAVNYAILNIGGRLAASMAAAGLVEWLLVGTAIGLVYRPGAARRTSVQVA